MSILDRYLAMAVLGGTAIALLVLVAVTAFFAFLGELSDLGKGGYGLNHAVQYTLYTLPRMTYEMFPMSALLGSLMGLGALAGNSELIVMRAIGMSVGRIMRSVALAGLFLMVIVMAIGEWLAPSGEQMAQEIRNRALSDTISFKGRLGYWVRDGRDFINIRELTGEREVRDITIFRFNEDFELKRWVEAERATWEEAEGAWRLYQVLDSDIDEDRVRRGRKKQLLWESELLPEMINVAVVKPETLSVWDLWVFVEYFRENGQDASRFELAFWRKLIFPLSSIVMVLLAVPFVFGSLRDTGTGQRVLVGVLVGIGFHIVNVSLSNLSLLQGYPPPLSASLPTLLFLAGGVYWIRRIR